ncbi:MAG: ABC transporter permease [Gemmatimonadota bacterium]
MTGKPGSDSPNRAERGELAYRALLLLYPPSFRRRYGQEMVEFHRDRLRAERRAGRPTAGVWRGAIRDAVTTLPSEYAAALARILSGRPGPAAVPPRHRTHRTSGEEQRVSHVGQDLRIAARRLLASPVFTLVVVATLALGIGANTAIFSVIRGVLLRPLPYDQPDRVVRVDHLEPYGNVAEAEFVDYRSGTRVFERVAAVNSGETNLAGGDEAVRVGYALVSDGFFAVLGTRPIMGRALVDDDERPSSPTVAVIGEALWREQFGSHPNILGRTVEVGRSTRTIVGVMPAQFAYPSAAAQVWMPMRLRLDSLATRNNHNVRMVGRLKDGVTPAVASVALNTLARRWLTEYPNIYPPGQPLVARVTPVKDELLGPTRPYLIALLGAVALVLLVACVNVANLLLVRGEGRRRELAIRAALGASSRRLASQLFAESAVLAATGGIAGLVLGILLTGALVASAPASIPRLGEIRIDPVVLLFTAALATLTGMLFGILPVRRAARTDSAAALKDGGKSSHGTVAGRMRRALVVAEVALSMTLLVGTSLLLRSLWTLQATDLGFRAAGAMTMRVSLPPKDYDDDRSVAAFSELTERVRGLPGVTGVTGMAEMLMSDGFSMWSILLDGKVVANVSEAPAASPQQVLPFFFRNLGIPIVRGREITAEDRADAPAVAVINETMARQLWPNTDALGHTFRVMGDSTAPWMTIVGVSRDVRSAGYASPTPPAFYVPYAQAGKSAYVTPRAMSLVIRTDGDPTSIVPAVRAAAREIEPRAPVSAVRTLEEVVAASIGERRFVTLLLAMLAALALTLASIGIYGVIAYGVSERRTELGIRLALGADSRRVQRLVVGEGVRIAVVGVVCGIAGAWGAGRLVQSLLVGVSAIDVPTFVATAFVLVGVAWAAALIPARRAARLDPLEAMRGREG